MMTPANVADGANGVSEPRQWYVAYVGPRAEKSVRDQLENQGVEAFAATQWEIRVWRNGRRKKLEVPVITQYVFVKVTETQRRQILQLPYIHSFLTDKATVANEFGRHALAVIPESQMEVLQRLLAQSDSHVRFATSGFVVGDKVRVLGWGETIEGEIVRIRGDKARYIGIRIAQLGCAYMEVSPNLLIKNTK